jgi:phosphatidylglycerophosphate synthase
VTGVTSVASVDLSRRRAVVIVPPLSDRRIVTGLTLAERARRVVVQAGISAAHMVVVSSAAELAAARDLLRSQPVLLLDASAQLVAASLLTPLDLGQPGNRMAVDPARGGESAGAWVLDADHADAGLDAVARSLADGVGVAVGLSDVCQRIDVDRRARFPLRAPGDLAAAIRWQYELVNKPLDAPICRYFYRPLARPLTILLLRTPLTPNVISVISILLSLVGCAIAASADLTLHVAGLAILLLGGIVDANDGEVARLRLEMSKTGAWLDAMGDDMARIALLLGMGGHIAAVHPTWPVWPITFISVAMTTLSLLLIYWYCIFVIQSSNNQDYTKALQIGPGVRAQGQRTIGQWVADMGAQVVRRDFIDLAAVLVAIVGGSLVTFSLLSLGSLVTVIVVIPTHLKIVKALRSGQLTRAVI